MGEGECLRNEMPVAGTFNESGAPAGIDSITLPYAYDIRLTTGIAAQFRVFGHRLNLAECEKSQIQQVGSGSSRPLRSNFCWKHLNKGGDLCF